MSKIMLVVDNQEDLDFMERVIVGLKYTVIAMRDGVDLSEKLIDHFPDVVFASTLGRNAKILSALGKIKEIRGKPKLVFVKQERESSALSPEQKRIIDGVLYSPIDPFKLIDVLSTTTEISKADLRLRYNEMLETDRNMNRQKEEGEAAPNSSSNITFVQGSVGTGAGDDYGNTQVFGGNLGSTADKIERERNQGGIEVDVSDTPASNDEAIKVESESSEPSTMQDRSQPVQSPGSSVAESTSVVSKPKNLIQDSGRKKKYDEIVANLDAKEQRPQAIDAEKLRQRQQAQAAEIEEGSSVKANRKHFLKTLFSTSISEVQKKTKN